MSIRFKCPHCKKPLVVKDHLAGKRAACPVCKKAVPIPSATTAPADVEALAAAALAGEPTAKPAADGAAPKTIDFDCPYCGEPQKVSADLSGKQTPCSACKRIIRVPVLKVDKPKDWREIAKKGPTAALVNLPEQLKDAWGTEQKTRVSGTALLAADALPEAEVEPIGVLGWLKRGFWTTLILGAIVIGYIAISSMRHEKEEKDDMAEVEKFLKSEHSLTPLLEAELHRGLGELKLRRGKPEDARIEFVQARAKLPVGPETTPPHEADLFLAQLAVSQVELGGTEEEERDKKRISWAKTKNEIVQTLQLMRTIEGKAAALRQVAGRLAERKMLEIAIGIAGELVADSGGERSPLLGGQVALLVAKDTEMAAKLLKPPGPNQTIDDRRSRIAYAERHARLGNYSEALTLVKVPGPAVDRLEAALAAAEVALADRKLDKPAAQAGPFVQEAAAAALELKERAPTMLVLLLIRLGTKSDEAPLVKQFVPARGDYGAAAQLQWFAGQTSRSAEPAKQEAVEEVGEPDTPVRSLAWCLFARHNARLGWAGSVRNIIPDLPEPVRPFLHAGVALGEQDARR